MPSFDGCNNGVWVFGPDEGFCLPIVLHDEAVDGGLKVGSGAEYAALEPLFGEFGEDPLHRVEPELDQA
jgi:hypothetical protein